MSFLARRDEPVLAESLGWSPAESPPTTDLAPVLSSIPWKDAFDYGVGVNAVSGEVTASAVSYTGVKQGKTKISDQSIHWVQSERELESTIGAAVEGQYNVQVLKVSTRNRYLEDLEISSVSMSLLAIYTTEYEGYDEARDIELTREAAELAVADPAGFRRLYGDYYLAGAHRRSSFIATYRCRAHSIEKLTSFHSAVGTGNDIFTATGSTEFSNKAREYDIEVEVRVRMVGYEGESPIVPTRPDEVLEALAWFQKHEKGVRVRALLKHYSHLVPKLSRSVEIAPRVFLDLQRLYIGVWKIRSLYRTCPERYREAFEERYHEVVNGITAHRSQLPGDGELRRSYYLAARALRHDLAEVFARQDFYFHVKARREKEPAEGERIEPQEYGQVTWMYGYERWSWGIGNRLEIQEKRLSWSHDWTPDAQHAFRFGPDERYLVVGWKVMSGREDGLNGEWWKGSETILLSDGGQVNVQNDFDRAINYSVNYYYVLADEYQFEDHAVLRD